METNHTPVAYPPRFFPQGMPVETQYGILYIDVWYTDHVHDSYINCTKTRPEHGIRMRGGSGFKPDELTPKPDGILGFNPTEYAALIAGRKTQITVPIRKKLFKAGNIVRVGLS